MATIRLIPSTHSLSNSNYLSVSNVDNMYTNTDSTTAGTCTHNRASTNSTYYLYLRGFNFSDVPSSATVSDFMVKIKASATGHTTSTSSSYYMSLINGTTQIASTVASGRLSTTTTTFTFGKGSLTWDTLVDYGSNFGIRIPLRRANANVEDVVSVYGAEIEVTYTVPNPRTVTSTLNGNGTISPSGATSTYEGAEYELVITPTDKTEPVTITNNGVDVTSQLVAHGVESTLSFAPNDVTTSGIQSGSSYAEYAVGNTAEDPSSSGTSSNMYASSYSTGYAAYSFDFSSIPSNATIESIEVRCYGHRESNTISSTYVSQCVLYMGNTAISETVDFPSTSNSIITIEPTTLPTRAQLNNVVVRHYVGYYGGLVLGITFEVTYSTGTGIDHYTYTYTVSDNATIAVTIGNPKNTVYVKINGTWVESKDIMIKVNGTWQSVTTVYKKVNGSWTQSTDISDMFVNNAYVKGGYV